MEVLEDFSTEIICEHCRAKLKFDKYDLNWYWGEPDYFYVVCPKCKKWVWINKSKETCRMYNEVTEELEKKEKESN